MNRNVGIDLWRNDMLIICSRIEDIDRIDYITSEERDIFKYLMKIFLDKYGNVSFVFSEKIMKNVTLDCRCFGGHSKIDYSAIDSVLDSYETYINRKVEYFVNGKDVDFERIDIYPMLFFDIPGGIGLSYTINNFDFLEKTYMDNIDKYLSFSDWNKDGRRNNEML